MRICTLGPVIATLATAQLLTTGTDWMDMVVYALSTLGLHFSQFYPLMAKSLISQPAYYIRAIGTRDPYMETDVGQLAIQLGNEILDDDETIDLIRHSDPAVAFYWRYYDTIDAIRLSINATDHVKLNQIGDYFTTVAPLLQDLVNGELADPLAWTGFALAYRFWGLLLTKLFDNHKYF